MPIRFRCPHCDQLLGIARRKAGAHVRCPSCRRDVAVPAEDEPSRPDAPALPPPVAPPAPAAAPPALFERDDFEQLLHGSVGPSVVEPPRNRGSAVRTPAPAVRAGPPAVAAPAAWAPALDPLPPGSVVLSPARATVLAVVMILLLALAFALGIVVDRFAL